MSKAEDIALEIHENLFGDEPIREEIEYIAREIEGHTNQALSELRKDIVQLKEYARNENWSMVEIQAEKLGYYFESN